MTTVFALYDGVIALDVFGAFDALVLADEYAAHRGLEPPFRPVLAAIDERPVRVGSGPRILPGARLRDVSASRAVIPGGVLEQTVAARRPVVHWLTATPHDEVVGICTGVFLLAEAGLLDGRRATTHWKRVGTLASRFPSVDVVEDALYVEDGSVWTSAGVTAGIDLAIALIRRELGAEVALAVARQLVVFAHRPGGQTQFSAHLRSQATEDEHIYRAQQWVLNNLRADLSVASLARIASMSPRNFSRRFVAETGVSPGKFVQRARVDGARTLLETSSYGLAAVAHRCGLESEESLRRLFLRHLSVTPGAYRSRFPG